MAMTLEQKLRSGHVRRWHIVAVSREQTIADHMHRVGVIAEEILTILGLFSWDNNLTLNTMRWAAIHDRHEFLLGDLPTPGKAAIRASEDWDAPAGKGDGITDAAAKIDPEAEELRQCVEAGGACSLAGDIVKAADLLEAMNYIGVFGCGAHAREVWYGLHATAFTALEQVVKAAGVEKSPASGSPWVALMDLKDKLREGRHWA